MFRLSVLAVALFLLVSCAGQCADFVPQVDTLLVRWDDITQAAVANPMSQVIEDWQTIRQVARDLQVPDCAQPAHAAALAYFDQVIEAEVAFLQQTKSEAALTDMFRKIEPLRAALGLELDKLRTN
jgi:hypothetical protein